MKDKVMKMMNKRSEMQWLSAAFVITLITLIAVSVCSVYRSRVDESSSAYIMAADILRLMEKEDTDTDRAVYIALIERQIGEYLTDEEQMEFMKHLLENENSQAVHDMTLKLETAVSRRSVKAKELREIFMRFIEDSRDSVSDAALASQNLVRTVSAGELPPFVKNTLSRLGLSELFRMASSDLSGHPVVYCRNAYAVFHPSNGEMQLYVADFTPGKMKYAQENCISIAHNYLKTRQRMYDCRVTDTVFADGIWYVYAVSGKETPVVGVREDCGGVCFFVRSVKNKANDLQ